MVIARIPQNGLVFAIKEALHVWSHVQGQDLQISITTEINAELGTERVHAGMAQTCRIRSSIADQSTSVFHLERGSIRPCAARSP